MKDRIIITLEDKEWELKFNNIIRFSGGGVELRLNKENGVLQLCDKQGKVLSEVDFPTERIIKNISYNEETQNLVFEFDNYPSVEVPIVLSNFATKDFVENKLTSKADLVDGKIPDTQIPDIIKSNSIFEAETVAGFPATGVIGSLYVSTSDNISYRWDGTAYVELSSAKFKEDTTIQIICEV